MTQAELDLQKKQRKKRTATEALGSKAVTTAATDLTKKRKVSETAEKNEKPWEKEAEEDVDYRWDICENC